MVQEKQIYLQPLRPDDFEIKHSGKHPMFPNENLIKVYAGSIIGYAKTENEAIQLIDELLEW